VAHILIVDDDESDRLLLRTFLTQDGHETYLAADGDEALALYGGTSIDVVVTDLQMPGMHGLELISLVRDMAPRPAIVAISGTGETQLHMADAIGADVVLPKPLTRDQVLAGVRDALATTAGRTGYRDDRHKTHVMQPAILGGLAGSAEVHSRLLAETEHEYRGTFAFRAQDEPEIMRLLESRDVVEYEGPIDGERRHLRAFVTDVSRERGIAFFQGNLRP
jgi:CheY-like chemotaxis protein